MEYKDAVHELRRLSDARQRFFNEAEDSAARSASKSTDFDERPMRVYDFS